MRRLQTVLTVIVVGAGLIFMLVMGLWVYVSSTATPLHPSLQDVSAGAGIALKVAQAFASPDRR